MLFSDHKGGCFILRNPYILWQRNFGLPQQLQRHLPLAPCQEAAPQKMESSASRAWLPFGEELRCLSRGVGSCHVAGFKSSFA